VQPLHCGLHLLVVHPVSVAWDALPPSIAIN